MMVRTFGGRRRVCRKAAIVAGIASFIISEGWKRMTPKSSQRVAPLAASPSSRVATSSSSVRRSEERREGKRVSVRVDLGGRRIIKKKKRKSNQVLTNIISKRNTI